MPIKWYKNGKLIPDDKTVEVKYTIIKAKTSSSGRGVFERHRFFIGMIEDGTIDLVSYISKTYPIGFDPFLSGIYLKRFVPLTPKDIINIKLGNVDISGASKEPSESFWKYSELVDIFGEEKIEFYTWQD